jgi:uncharacterized SAM-dependent methyltransferase
MIARVVEHAVPVEEFASDVCYYLSLHPRQLPSRYFYDDLGSALFDAICRLPWYRITRAETRLLAEHGRAILARAAGLSTIVELGPGSGEKLATLVEAGRSGQGHRPHLDLRLVDISRSALELASRTLGTLPDVSVATYQARYETGLLQASAETPSGRELVLFLGSNIGNFDRPGADAFLRGVRAGTAAGDMLLLGADLVKRERDLILAYDDPLGVTAAFNRNLLVRINRSSVESSMSMRFAPRGMGRGRVARRNASRQPRTPAGARRRRWHRLHHRERRVDLDRKLLKYTRRNRRGAGAGRIRPGRAVD